MAILTERKVWKRPPAPKPAIDRINRLTPEEAENVRAALHVARALFGTLKGLARQMGVTRRALVRFSSGESKATAGLALRIARLVGVSVEDVLSGAYAKPHKCPTCGHPVPISD